jgi:hypothetical protein
VLTRLRARLRRVIRAPSRIIDFELEHVGLYYAYNTRGHGRVVFVPVARLFG